MTSRSPNERSRLLVELACFCYALLVACPVRYWPIENDIDSTWVFASNYAAAHGLAFGRDIVWTSGPLGYLTFPQDLGNNVPQGLLFQFAIWSVVAFLFRELFFKSGFPVRNLVIFTLFWSLSGPLYWYNRAGLEALCLATVLLLLLMFRWKGGTFKLMAALALVGLLPLIKLSAGLSAAGALAGFALDSVLRMRQRAWALVLASLVIPAAVLVIAGFTTLHYSWTAFGVFIHASREISAGYSLAMSHGGAAVYLVLAAAALLFLIIAMLWMLPREDGLTRSYALILAVPLFVSFKEGFVRQDDHILMYFCFVALALALVSLKVARIPRFTPAMVAVLPLSLILLQHRSALAKVPLAQMTGLPAISRLVRLPFGLGAIRGILQRDTRRAFSASDRLDSVVRAAVGDSPVAYLSVAYSAASIDKVSLRIYPVIQRYAAYTPFLDRLNADWIEQQGPKYLIFNGSYIDDRHPWVETPAMWLQIYKWYDTDIVTARDLLLVRRAAPRFSSLERIRSDVRPIGAGLVLPPSRSPLFWTMKCPVTKTGWVEQAIFRVPEVAISIQQTNPSPPPARVIMSLLSSPVLGTYLPTTLDQFAKLLSRGTPDYSVRKITFEGPGLKCYSSRCTVDLWEPKSWME